MLMTAFWFVSGSLTCRNSGRSGQRKSPVEWEVNKKEKKRKKTTRFYFCPGRQQPKVQKPLNLNGTVGPIVARSKPKPGHLDLKPNRAFLLLWVLFLGCFFFFLPPKRSSWEGFFFYLFFFFLKLSFKENKQVSMHVMHVMS